MEIMKGARKDFMLISGDDLIALPLISLGAKGVISVIANAFPIHYGKSISAALKGNFEEARKFHYQLLEIDKMLFEECNPAGVKTALEILGVCTSEVRLPLVKGTDNLYQRLKLSIEQLPKV
jgi:4-hydroxy-tetrahydrodipicolinate synthase